MTDQVTATQESPLTIKVAQDGEVDAVTAIQEAVIGVVAVQETITVTVSEQGGVGTGDMQSLIYDPQGIAANVFNAANLYGYIDCGEF